MATDLILGTAGHIDHGKTALIKALTGVDTDRLPEEQKRGITIELGYAQLDLGEVRLGVVDVPGHERFVRNMLAGATGVDVALLVVAADDSVMPQTREHLDILRLLDMKIGVIALTKCDLSTPDWLDLVESDIRDLVEGTFLADAPIVRTSATTGKGIDALRSAISVIATRSMGDDIARHPTASPFRMAIDRTFTIAGHGTVVTGSVVSGSTAVSDELVIEPGGVSVRVRGLQNHDDAAESVHRGQRAAINLAGIHHSEVQRGQELATPGFLQPSQLLTVRLDLLSSAPRPLKNRSRVRVHLGTTDILATVALLEIEKETAVRALSPGATALAQLHLSEEVVATWRQPFVVRWPSPVETIGGGIVLQSNPRRLRPRDTTALKMAAQLGSDDEQTRVNAAFYFAGLNEFDPIDLFRASGVADAKRFILSLVAEGTLIELTEPRGTVRTVHRGVLEEIAKRVSNILGSLHLAEPLRRGFDAGDVGRIVMGATSDTSAASISRGAFPYWPTIVDRLEAMGVLELQKDRSHIALVGAGPQLSRGEKTLLDDLIEKIRQAGVEPPTVDVLIASAEKNKKSVPKLLELAAADRSLVRVSESLYLHSQTWSNVQETLQNDLARGRGMTLSEIRELLGTTRKYAVPICEQLDATQFTLRRGNQRYLAK